MVSVGNDGTLACWNWRLVIQSDYIWRAGRFELFQSIPTQSALDVHSFLACGRRMLAIAGRPNITVYEMTGSMFREYQSVRPPGVKRITTFEYGGKTFLTASAI